MHTRTHTRMCMCMYVSVHVRRWQIQSDSMGGPGHKTRMQYVGDENQGINEWCAAVTTYAHAHGDVFRCWRV